METSQEAVIIPTDIAPAITDAEQVKSAEQATTPETVEDAAKPSDKQADKTFTQAELDEIVQKRISKFERKAERTRIESETRAKVMDEINSKPAESVLKPDVNNFSDYGEYLEAIADWKADEKINARIEAERTKEATSKQQSENQRVEERKHDLVSAGEKKYDDFEEVVVNSKVNLSEPARLAMLESDISHEIAYYLAKNPKEAERFASLPAYAQAKEIGKLEDKLMSKAPPKVSAAPEPMKPIGSGQSLNKSVEEMTMAEYKAHRLSQKPKWA